MYLLARTFLGAFDFLVGFLDCEGTLGFETVMAIYNCSY